jgi:hypothetical protein
LTPGHGAPPGLPQIMVKLLPMSPDGSVTYVSRLYLIGNKSLQPTIDRCGLLLPQKVLTLKRG